MGIQKVLVVDDESIIRNLLGEILQRKGLEVHSADSGESALAILEDQTFDLVITDMKMGKKSGIDVLKKVKESSPDTAVLVITGHGTIENAVQAMQLGAFNYLLKPFTPEAIETLIKKVGEHNSLVQENQYLRQNSGSSRNLRKIIAQDPITKEILANAEKIAKSQANVFITGESGTGKEVIAQVIHTHSERAKYPFIKVNCAAVPDTLIESEFFGHEKGAFTGAQNKRAGRFELANHGTLLLDEVTEIPLAMQSKLLRVTQEQEFERVGGTKPLKVDVRLVSTTNRDFKEMIEQKVFRQDLFYRLNVIPIHLPPLRERREDIVPLAEYFLEQLCAENHKKTMHLNEKAKKKLLGYEWPGNVRELANVIERGVVLSTSNVLDPEHLFLENSFSFVEK
jgi:two-component system, NtrC family, response regulator AtoC